MQNIILSITTLLVFGLANAQEPTKVASPSVLNTNNDGKGFLISDIIVTGTVGFSKTTVGNEKQLAMEFSPSAAYFVSKHFALGIVGGFTMVTFDDGDETGNDATDLKLSLGPLVRYYGTPASKFSFFGQFTFKYNTTISNSGGVDETDFTTNGYEIAVSPGVSYFISKHFALEAALGAFKTESIKSELDDVPSKYIFTSKLDLTDVAIGVVYKF